MKYSFLEIRKLISSIKYFNIFFYTLRVQYIIIVVNMHYHFRFCRIFTFYFFLLIENQYPPRGISIFITTHYETPVNIEISHTTANDNDISIIPRSRKKPVQKFYFRFSNAKPKEGIGKLKFGKERR